jgi:hypothetical protein
MGRVGGGLGWSGIPGFAVAFDTFQNIGDPSYNTVGVAEGFDPLHPDRLNWTSFSANAPSLRKQTRHIVVTVTDHWIFSTVDGVPALHAPVALPRKMLIGFTAASGRRSDQHLLSNIQIKVS